ncbi:AMP-binding protein [Arcanobacterium buesumense]|uniref:AMP-binding protein n=1 Tax=Arcanobacterium buesumense TaxID=2722751 RepID=A0A6H2EJ56_9ACTO|nr:AMP-binding protein [Arcanobacterium buesumense]QJC21598.1 AMP-binding protein [Arcanobacterium buesumense]
MTHMQRAHEHYPHSVNPSVPIPDHTVERMLIDAVADFPQRVAIDFLGREWTYEEIANEVERAITVLKMCGVREGDVVSVILPNCPQHFVAFYAITALGATIAEHNPLAPVAQLNDQIELVGSTVVIAWEQTIERLLCDGDFRGRTYLSVNLVKALPAKSQFLLQLPIKAAREQRAKLRGRVPAGVHSWDNQVKYATPSNIAQASNVSPDSIAVLLQTGGTTGTPKAVKLSHRNIVANAKQNEAWLITYERGKETVAAVLPFFHAFGLQLSLSVCVNSAATIVMTPSFDVDILLAGHARHPITFFGGVPPMYKKILDSLDEGKKVDLSTIRFSVSGAMPLDPQLAARWEKATGGYIIEGYGMSEASPVIAASPVSPDRRPSTLGIPFPSTEVKIIDPDDPTREILPEHEVGEICARGPQVFQGYLRDEEETAHAFTPDGWLRTGDLGYWDDGFIVMADRRKEMIINGGFNVYPSQVEEAVRQMPGVVDVAVVGMPTDSFSESVVAALVLEPGSKVDIEAVRQWTEDKLAHYAIPKSIAILDELPRSQIGKVMRRSVREKLSSFELNSGQWREKLSEASSSASSIIDEYLANLRERAEASKEDWKNWTEQNSETFEALRAKFADKMNKGADKTTLVEELDTTARQSGLSVENFKNWVAHYRSELFTTKSDIKPNHAAPTDTVPENQESDETD